MIVGGTPSMVRQWHSGTWLVALAALVAAPRAAAGQPVNGDCEVALTSVDFVSAGADLGRVLDLLGAESRHSFAVRRASDRTSANACNVPAALRRLSRSFATPQPPERGAAVLPAYLRVAANSDYPRDWNNGAQWAGTGASASLNGGATFRWYWFEAAFAPLLTVQENLAYDLTRYPDSTTYSAYIDRWHGRFIDLPQRFGIGAFSTLDAGQSYARVRVAGWRAGVSNENLSWGPARRNPLLLSGTAPGFPHVFIETSRPNNVVLGTAELQLFW